MKIFITWSGTTSHRVALSLRDWLSTVVPAASAFVSSDIRKGGRWLLEVARELEDTNFGILCVVRGNERSPWLNFEAGALSRSVNSSMVAPFLVGLEPADLPATISQFQCTRYDEEDLLKLVSSFNTACGQAAISETRLNSNFKVAWPGLKQALDKELQALEATSSSPEVVDENHYDDADIRIGIRAYLRKYAGGEEEQTLDLVEIAREIGDGVSIDEVKSLISEVVAAHGCEIKDQGKLKVVVQRRAPRW